MMPTTKLKTLPHKALPSEHKRHLATQMRSAVLANNLRGISQRLNWSGSASTALVCSDTDSYSESLPLSWHDSDSVELQGIQQVIQQPTTIETSNWIKLILGKECKAFGINIVGFEHEILHLILRMDQKRHVQLQKRDLLLLPVRKERGGIKGNLKFKILFTKSTMMGGRKVIGAGIARYCPDECQSSKLEHSGAK